MKYIREKKVRFGSGYLDVDLFEMTDGKDPPLRRAKRKRISPPHIIEANDRHSRNHLRQLVIHNFGVLDLYVTCTYAGENPSAEYAQRELQNFIARLKRLYSRYDTEFKAIYVTEGGAEKDGGYTRVHHHLVMSGGVPRDEVERCWRGRQDPGAETRRGYCNTALIQPDAGERGCERIAEYLAKSRTKNLDKGRRRWNCTRNIKRPVETVVDNRFSKKQSAELIADAREIQKAVKAESWERLRRLLEKRYDREMIDVIASVNPVDGHVYLSARFRRQQACFIKQRK